MSDEVTMSVEGQVRANRRALSDDELLALIDKWEKSVEACSGFASAKEAALQLKFLVLEAQRRGMRVENKFPLGKGS